MIDLKELRLAVIRPALQAINLWCLDAEELLIATCAQETKGGLYLVQETRGGEMYMKGGLGIYQMEAATHESLWLHRISNMPELKSKIMTYCDFQEKPAAGELVQNLGYASIMTRIFYHGIEEPLPPANNVEAMGVYWKKYYNTVYGAGTVDEFVKSYHTYVGTTVGAK